MAQGVSRCRVTEGPPCYLTGSTCGINARRRCYCGRTKRVSPLKNLIVCNKILVQTLNVGANYTRKLCGLPDAASPREGTVGATTVLAEQCAVRRPGFITHDVLAQTVAAARGRATSRQSDVRALFHASRGRSR